MTELHPEVVAYLAQVAAAGRPPLHKLSPAAARAQAGLVTTLLGSGPELARVEERELDIGTARLRARAYRLTVGVTGTIVWFHGGGWVLGGLDSHDSMCRRLARASGFEVVAVEYRLAPEHPFPTPVRDCWAALRLIASERSGPLVVGGDSAGGNLAAVCALRARADPLPLCAQVLVYPVCDHDFATSTYLEHGDEGAPLTRREMAWFWDLYLPDPLARSDPQASPLHATDVSGATPAIVVLAGHDPLLDEGRAYADRLRAAGVPVLVRHDADMIHGYVQYASLFSVGRDALEWIGRQIRDLAGTLDTSSKVD